MWCGGWIRPASAQACSQDVWYDWLSLYLHFLSGLWLRHFSQVSFVWSLWQICFDVQSHCIIWLKLSFCRWRGCRKLWHYPVRCIDKPAGDVEFSKSRGSRASKCDTPLVVLHNSDDVFVLVCGDSPFSLWLCNRFQLYANWQFIPHQTSEDFFHKARFTSDEAQCE